MFAWNKKNILDKKILLTYGTKLEKFSSQEFCSNKELVPKGSCQDSLGLW
jgi:hypothetical protein